MPEGHADKLFAYIQVYANSIWARPLDIYPPQVKDGQNVEQSHSISPYTYNTSKVPGRCPWIPWMVNSNTLKKLLKIQNGDTF